MSVSEICHCGDSVTGRCDGSAQKCKTPCTKEKADRHNEGKLQWSLVDFTALEDMVRVLAFGAEKYSADNWKQGLTTKSIFDSMTRHEVAFMSGEDLDPESGLPHTAHILCNAMFLAWMVKNRPEFDNR